MQKLINVQYLIEKIIFVSLPQGYRISQFKDPIIGRGKVILDMPVGQKSWY